MIGVINYGAGNIFSLTAALERLGIPFGMINGSSELDRYDRYIIPGVGHAGAAMKKLGESGLIPLILSLKKPVLGVCVGMQLLTSHSEEGNSHLTDIIPLKTKHFGKDLKLKVPHTGWNKVNALNGNKLFNGIQPNTHFYFVHSYYIEFSSKFTIASAQYGTKFSAAIQNSNFYGVQFHPEKSGEAGEQLLKNFSKINN